MRSLERERDLLRCFRFREPERDLDRLLFGDLECVVFKICFCIYLFIVRHMKNAVQQHLFQVQRKQKRTYLERDRECVLERVLIVFFSSASKLSSSRPSGPSSRSISYNGPTITPHLCMCFFYKHLMERTCCWLSMESSSLSVSGSCAWLLFCMEATQLSWPKIESCPSIEMVCKNDRNQCWLLTMHSTCIKSVPDPDV